MLITIVLVIIAMIIILGVIGIIKEALVYMILSTIITAVFFGIAFLSCKPFN